MGHLHSFVLLLLLVIWPMPWAIQTMKHTADNDRHLDSGALFSGCLVWLLLQFLSSTMLGLVGLLSLWPLLILQVGGFGTGVWSLKQTASARAAIPRSTPSTKVILGLIGGGALALAWITATIPTANFDSLGYHLPAVAEFYQHSGVIDLPGSRATASYPFGWELASVPLIIPFGHDLLVTWPNVAAWLLLGLATAHLSRLMGADRYASVAGALLVLGTPHLMGRINTVQVDVALAALFVSSCAAAMHVRRGDHRIWTVLLLVLGGMCAAIKFSGIMYWVASLGFLLTTHRVRPHARPRLGRALMPGLTIALICGGYWYLRNLIQDGSPFGRIGISVAGRTLLPGEYGGESMATSTLMYALGTGGQSAWMDFMSLLQGGLGWTILPLVLLAGLGLTYPRRPALPIRNQIVLAGMIIVAGLLYSLTPASANMGRQDGVTSWAAQALRFAYPWLGLMGVAAALGWSRIKAPGTLKLSVGLVMFGIGIVQECGPAISTVAIIIGLIVTGLPTPLRWTAVALVMVALVPAAHQRDLGRHRLYGPSYAVLDSLSPESIGVEITRRPYPFYGHDLRRNIVVLSGSGSSRQDWLAMIREHNLPYVVIGPLPHEVGRTAKQRLGWLSGRKAREFKPIYRGSIQNDVQIYKVLTDQRR